MVRNAGSPYVEEDAGFCPTAELKPTSWQGTQGNDGGSSAAAVTKRNLCEAQSLIFSHLAANGECEINDQVRIGKSRMQS